MAYFPWSQDYSVGIRLIDNDHKDLVDMVNSLHDQISGSDSEEQIATTLAFLARYVREHFTREEALMAQYGYPDLAAHKASHHELAAEIHAAQKVFTSEPERLDPQKLLLFLRDWLVHHILSEDMKYVPYLIGGAGDAPAATSSPPAPAKGQAQPDEMVTVEVEVPADKVELIRRCAHLLSTGGEIADEIEVLAEPAAAMTLEDAETLIEPLLR